MTNPNINKLELEKVLQMLSKECSNSFSKELAMNLTPDSDIDTVRLELKKVSDAFSLSVRFKTPEFYDFPNMDASIGKAAGGGELSAKELLDINQILRNTNLLLRWHKQVDEECSLDGLFGLLFDETALSKKISTAIISEEEISDDASEALFSIRKSLARRSAKLRESLEAMLKSSSINKHLQENLVTIRDGRYVLPVKAESKRQVPGLVHDTSSSGATVFIEPMHVVEANNELAILKGREQEEIHKILSELSSQVGAQAEMIKSSFKGLVYLNLYFAKANLAAKMNACVPKISDDGIIVLKKARHPLIDKDRVVPIDFSLGESYKILIVTGPNTGGKTVILKTVGLLTLMTMCGMMIPVSDGSTITVFDKILVDIGDNQSIENDLSTFSSHIKNVGEILKKADGRSLVLLDELGSGTDPVEGAALAVAVTQKLRGLGADTVITTHYQELKMYALETDDVQNASCEFDMNTLTPTYRLIIGAPGSSNAFEISRRLGISDEIISYAKSLIDDDSKRLDNILDELESARLTALKEREEADKIKFEAERERREAAAERDRLQRDKENILSQAKSEAAALLRKISRESDALIDELNSIKKENDKSAFESRLQKAKSHTKTTLDDIYAVSSNDEIYDSAESGIIKKGDSVVLVGLNTKGTVLSNPDASGVCMVQAGAIKAKLSTAKLRLVKEEKKSGGSVSKSGVIPTAKREVKAELDIRGYMIDEGIFELDSFLDGAVMTGIGIVTVIHGKGTGALKNAVRAHLKNHKQVKSFRRGIYGEGEDGVTVIELK